MKINALENTHTYIIINFGVCLDFCAKKSILKISSFCVHINNNQQCKNLDFIFKYYKA